jgi:hypothetical protein
LDQKQKDDNIDSDKDDLLEVDGNKSDDAQHSEYPETVEFSGVGYTSLLQVHISAALIAVVGVILAIEAPPEGLFALIAFLIFILGIEMWMFRRSQKKLRLTLYLWRRPVEAYQGDYRIGRIDHGAIETDMENLNDLGYRPAPKKNLIVWSFDSEHEKQVVAKRLLEYLPRDRTE